MQMLFQFALHILHFVEEECMRSHKHVCIGGYINSRGFSTAVNKNFLQIILVFIGDERKKRLTYKQYSSGEEKRITSL